MSQSAAALINIPEFLRLSAASLSYTPGDLSSDKNKYNILPETIKATPPAPGQKRSLDCLLLCRRRSQPVKFSSGAGAAGGGRETGVATNPDALAFPGGGATAARGRPCVCAFGGCLLPGLGTSGCGWCGYLRS